MMHHQHVKDYREIIKPARLVNYQTIRLERILNIFDLNYTRIKMVKAEVIWHFVSNSTKITNDKHFGKAPVTHKNSLLRSDKKKMHSLAYLEFV